MVGGRAGFVVAVAAVVAVVVVVVVVGDGRWAPRATCACGWHVPGA